MAINVKSLRMNVHLKNLFRLWLNITIVFHKLTKQEMDVLALLLFYHYELAKDITSKKILWKMVFDYEIKTKIKKELGIKDASLQNVLSSLRKKGIINDNQIVSTYIPNIEKGSDTFKIVFHFNIIDG